MQIQCDIRKVSQAQTVSFSSYLDDLINPGFIEIDKGNFLAKELDIDRCQRTAVGLRPPLRELWKRETSLLYM